MKNMLTTLEVAKKFGCTPQAVSQWVRRGLLPDVRHGNQYVFAESVISRFNRPAHGRPRKPRKKVKP